MRHGEPHTPELIDLQREQSDVCDGNWMQGRYYGDEGKRVRDMLSFNTVFDIHPFEVGVNRRAERRMHREKLGAFTGILGLGELMNRRFLSLSNGEMRRVLFARTLLKNRHRLALVSPTAGLDASHRQMFRKAVESLNAQGWDITVIGDVETGNPRCSVKNETVHHTAGKISKPGAAVVEMSGITLRFGRRTLFKNLSWTVRAGERWLLCGPNGSGKTTLLAFITGDSPLAYAYDIRIFGVPRANGSELSQVRRRIAAVSPEMQAYLGTPPETLLDQALAQKPDLLLLDEPCCNLSAKAARKMLSRIERWLDAHPQTAAVCIAHSAAHVPAGFDHLLDLGRKPDSRRIP